VRMVDADTVWVRRPSAYILHVGARDTWIVFDELNHQEAHRPP